jgi:hypothetical protein
MGAAFRILLAAMALSTGGLASAPAAACIYHPTGPCFGPDCDPSPVERIAQERLASARETKMRLASAKARLESAQVDIEGELAELLVPNVRPIYRDSNSCGPQGEVDYGKGEETLEGLHRIVLAGTPLEGRDTRPFNHLLREEVYSFGPLCNAEFRRSFAEFLRRSVSPAHRREAWLFLGARQRNSGLADRYHRLVAFERDSRSPPVRWTLADRWLSDQVDRSLRRTAWGRSIAAAADSFWTERSGGLGDNARVCPETTAEWAEMRERVVAEAIRLDSGVRRPGSRP